MSSRKVTRALDLTDKELYQLSLSMYSRLCNRDTYFTKGSARIFNTVLNKIRKSAEGRKNQLLISKALGDELEEGEI